MMIVRMAFPERVGPSVEPGTVIANKYMLLRCNATDARPSWLARNIGDDSLCTLHLMEPAEGEAAREAFEREMEHASSVRHPQLVPIVDYGWDDTGLLFTAEQRVEAPSLADLLSTGALQQARTVELVSQLLRVLDVVHAAGLTHGDLQLKQLLIRRAAAGAEELLVRGLGRARFTPFHVSQPEDSKDRVSAEWIVGSPEYASPEQLCGEPHDARSDVYAVGLVMFRLLTGCSPFASTRTLELAFMHRFSLPRPPSMFVGLHPELETVCLKALSKTPELRYQSASEMLEALAAANPAAQGRPSRFSLAAMRRVSAPPATPLLLPARAGVGAVEVRSSVLPQSRPRDWSVPLALGILTFTFTSIALIAGPRLGLWPASDEADASDVAEAETSLAPSLDGPVALPAEPRIQANAAPLGIDEPATQAGPSTPEADGPAAEENARAEGAGPAADSQAVAQQAAATADHSVATAVNPVPGDAPLAAMQATTAPLAHAQAGNEHAGAQPSGAHGDQEQPGAHTAGALGAKTSGAHVAGAPRAPGASSADAKASGAHVAGAPQAPGALSADAKASGAQIAGAPRAAGALDAEATAAGAQVAGASQAAGAQGPGTKASGAHTAASSGRADAQLASTTQRNPMGPANAVRRDAQAGAAQNAAAGSKHAQLAGTSRAGAQRPATPAGAPRASTATRAAAQSNRAEPTPAPAPFQTYQPSSPLTREEILQQWGRMGIPAPVTLAASTPAAAERRSAGAAQADYPLTTPTVIVEPATATPASDEPTAGPSVAVARTRVRGAVSSASLREALNLPSIERCYWHALEQGAAPNQLRAQLDLETEISGRISSVSLHGDGVPATLSSCVEAVRFGRVRGADTGVIHASVELVFQRR